MMKMIRLLIVSLLFYPFSIAGSQDPDGSWAFGVEAARASDDDDDDDSDNSGSGSSNSGSGSSDDDEDDDDSDNSGSGSGNSGSGSSDDDDDDDDYSTSAGENTPQVTTSQPSNQSSRVPENLHLRYPNGWDEKIRNGRYILTDPKGRTVTNRPAAFSDLERMRDIAGL